MSDWIGPNIYRIENHKDRKVAVTLKDGKGDNGSAVVMMANDAGKNDRWAFAHAGSGASGKDEYHILNSKTGTYLTCPEGTKQDKVLASAVAPANKRVRWNIIPCRNGTGAYWITASGNPKMILVSIGEGTANDTALQIWQGPVDSKGAWWYLILDNDDLLQCPDNGRAPRS